ncbi:MAG TPA: T9SS type A sorting domain-containing protein [Candidatus Kapabacteria bacterium]
MKRTLSLLLLVLSLAFVMPNKSSAQGTPSEGKDYYLGFLYPSFNRVIPAFSAGFFRIYAIISTFQDNTAYVSYFDENGNEEAAQPYAIQARKAVQIPLSVAKLRMTDPGDLIKEYKALHITAKKPINVQFFSSGGSSCGMYLCLPTNGLGTKYVVQSYFDNPDGELAMLGGRGPAELDVACGYFMVIGAYNGTSVTITPTSTTQGGKHPGVISGPGSSGAPQPYTISLNRGQCYMVKSHCGSNDNDISGTIVESDRPVAVMSGHENMGYGSVSGRSLEGRDYMVEQMMPVDYWDNTGYVSIPMVDSDPYNADATGENYRTYTYDLNGARIDMSIAGFQGTATMDIGRYNVRDKFEVESPVDFSSNDGAGGLGNKFAVSMIDIANQSAKQPFPRPSMMTIIPMSRWRNAYLWFVPSNVDERLQAYYINVIGPKAKFDSIFISKGGQKDVLIGQAGLAVVKVYQNIPNHPELIGKTFKVVPGSYYARANFPFMIYHYGNRAIDADGDLGDFDNDDNFFAYALPLGAVLGTGDTARMTITVDTLCTGWKICATDHSPNGGIKSAFLADDPIGDIYPYDPKVRGPYQYYNTSFTPDLDPNATREIIFEGLDTTECFDVTIDNIGKDGYAPIMITDSKGNGKMIELYYKKAAVAYNPSPDTVTSFGLIGIGDVVDKTFIFDNLPASKKQYIIDLVELIKKTPGYEIISIVPPLTANIAPKDTNGNSGRFEIKVRFTAKDTGTFVDSLKMRTDCFTTYWPLEVRVGTGIIITSDHDFGNVIVGSTACTDTIKIHNIGNMPFTLTPGYVLFDNVDFSYNGKVTTSNNREQDLPVVIKPGDWVKIRVCFTPHASGLDSTDLLHKTDIKAPYEHTIKDVNHLYGTGIKPGVNWDRPKDSLTVTCEDIDTSRRYLINSSTAEIRIDSIFIAGPDAAQFKIIGIQNALELGISVGDSIWVDFTFQADLSKPYTDIRNAYLIATNTFDKGEPDTVDLIGRMLHAEITLNPSAVIDLGNIPFGVPSTGGFSLTNTGDAPLIITGIDMPNPWMTDLQPPISLPDTIMPGEAIPYFFEITPNAYLDTTVTLYFMTTVHSLCTPNQQIQIHYVVSNKKVATTGFQSTPTYVDCRQGTYNVSITNEGTVPLNLLSVEIINETPGYTDADQFVFESNGQRLITYQTPIVLTPVNGKQIIPTLFKPTREGQLSARVRFVYDSAGITKDTIMNIITGTGVKLDNIFSAQNPAGVGVNYVAKTGEPFRLPVRFNDAVEQPADVYGVRVNVTYKRDVIDFKDVEGMGPYGATYTGPVYNGDGTETLTITAMAGQQVLNPDVFAEVIFQVMVAKDSTTDIMVSDGEFLGQDGSTLCYFDKQYLPGQFAAEYQCGDESISEYMNGRNPTRIVQVSPNPSTPAGNIKVLYDVNIDELPVTIELFNALGAKVRTIQTNSVLRKGTYKASFDTKGIPTGTYTLRVTSPESSQTETFVITK